MRNEKNGWLRSVAKTNEFYNELNGYSYTDKQVDRWRATWFESNVSLKGDERVLDLCCGDGVWSFGLLRRFPHLRVTGVDVSDKAIEVANKRANQLGLNDRAEFITRDCENELPFPREHFDLIFARGVFVFNQHDMHRQGCLALLNYWHSLLKPGGLFVAMYGSQPQRLGTYTPANETRGLPTNLRARETAAVNFEGGKFNHSPKSFISPFLELKSAVVSSYQFLQGRHTLVMKQMPIGINPGS